MELVAGACEGDCFFFHCASASCVSSTSDRGYRYSCLGLSFLLSVAGHTTQKKTDGDEEEDGMDECLYSYLFSPQINFDNDRYRDQ